VFIPLFFLNIVKYLFNEYNIIDIISHLVSRDYNPFSKERYSLNKLLGTHSSMILRIDYDIAH